MKKFGILCLALVIALGALGVGYAAWTDTVFITGTVNTGELCMAFADCNLLDDDQPVNPGGDYPTANPDYTCNNGFAFETEEGYFWELDKNVAWGEQLISQDGKTLEVTLHNAYPCNFNELGFYVLNCGTIPLKIDHILINGQPFSTGVPYVQIDFNQDGYYDFEIQWGNNWGAQIDPDGRSPEFSFWMHTLQPCPQDQLDTLTFTIEIVGVQWNEYPLGS
ncbi:MAG: hypothetical protein HQ588_04470 [Deltaproteobacteria bacterium]|nr:hypothetical protein [Deltaproteobacteria bacterium]